MNVLYTKEKRRVKKLPRKTQESLSNFARCSSNQDSLASGDGDCARCCRLCGGDTMLKYFRDSYVWEGVEQSYDQLLYDCFGVKVTSSDCMICDWCIRSLRGTEKFRALVHAAFEPTASKSDMALDTDASSTLITIRTNSCQTTNVATKKTTGLEKQEQRTIAKKVDTQKKRTSKGILSVQDKIKKKVIVSCDVCKQKYPIMASNGVTPTFICSRCKKTGEMKNAVCRKCNIAMPSQMLKEHMDMHLKADFRGSSRLRQSKKQLSVAPTVVLVSKTKNQGTKRHPSTSKPTEAVTNFNGDNEWPARIFDEQEEEAKKYLAVHHCEEHHSEENTK